MIVWKQRDDGSWAGTASLPGGRYVIQQLRGPSFDTDYVEADRCFLVSYRDEEGLITELGTAGTLGGARVLAGEHCFDLLAAAKARPTPAQPEVLGVPWWQLPLKIRRLWWRKTDYERRRPSTEFMTRLPKLLAAAQIELENEKCEIAADTARARELLCQAQQPSCEQCLRPASPCKVRCLRSIRLSAGPR